MKKKKNILKSHFQQQDDPNACQKKWASISKTRNSKSAHSECWERIGPPLATADALVSRQCLRVLEQGQLVGRECLGKHRSLLVATADTIHHCIQQPQSGHFPLLGGWVLAAVECHSVGTVLDGVWRERNGRLRCQRVAANQEVAVVIGKVTRQADFPIGPPSLAVYEQEPDPVEGGACARRVPDLDELCVLCHARWIRVDLIQQEVRPQPWS